MQANDIDNDSEHLSDIREGDVPGFGNAVVHELNRIRAEALRDIDERGFSRFHLKLCFVAGTGIFRDAYDIFAINLASIMLGCVYGDTPGPGLAQRLSRNQDFGIKVAAPVGNLFGQLLFRWLADVIGRKRMYGVELMIILTSTFAQALAGSGPGVNIISLLILWRFIMGVGVGVGGDHPLSAVIASKFASIGNRDRLMTMVLTAQGWGNFAASLVALIIAHAYRDSILTDSLNDLEHVDYCWRILIALGCVPGAIALYFRFTIPETPRFTVDIDRDMQGARADIGNVLGGPNGDSAALYRVDPDAVVQRAAVPRRSRSDFIKCFAQPGSLLLLVEAAYSWFAIDVAFNGLGLNSSSTLTSALLTRAGVGSAVIPSDLTTTLGKYELLRNVVIGSLVVCVAGLLPGYCASAFPIDVWRRRPIQFLGFAVLTVLLAILAAGIYPGTQSTGL